ncbi:3-deoxy-D-manno-octulosonic acid transferase [Desulfatirhabdium butyrativorans]|uniref:3-deoxy-D-manno-octulosonic acid transferase n=1 Tax=Desulfatirhabdium butyrativorans TaxID=340467 RepID=UPI0006857725|nr:glycosyltransferase N-terminal domain-containing protein [Desulfatirhabdium butyrativorans]
MSSWYTIYRWASAAIFGFGFVPLAGYSLIDADARKRLADRLGIYRIARSDGCCPRIWLHAASMGEVTVAESIIAAIRSKLPEAQIVLSAMTPHGFRHGVARMPADVDLIQAPLDVAPLLSHALNDIRPDLLVLLETEIWPNWIMETARRKIPIAMVNGRISSRSIGRYRLLRPLMAEILPKIGWFSMIHEADAERIASIGAPAERIVVNGNAKFDMLCRRADPGRIRTIRASFGVDGDDPVFLAGSLRGRESVRILDVYRLLKERLPELRLILAPRHLQRIGEIVSALHERKMPFVLKTRLASSSGTAFGGWDVLVLDTMGELFDAYALADVVFCGGSLVPKGGQNIMEPASWGKPVLYGPHMEDFQDARLVLEREGGGGAVRDDQELYRQVLRLLQFPDEALRMGQKARTALVRHEGASERHAEGLLGMLGHATCNQKRFLRQHQSNGKY